MRQVEAEVDRYLVLIRNEIRERGWTQVEVQREHPAGHAAQRPLRAMISSMSADRRASPRLGSDPLAKSAEPDGASAPAPRLPQHVEVRFEDDRTGFVDADAGNISLTGVFIRTQRPRPAGTLLKLELKLSDDFQFEAVGEAIWSRPKDESDERPAGMGVLFLRFDGDGREILSLFMDLHSQRRDRTEVGDTAILRRARRGADRSRRAPPS